MGKTKIALLLFHSQRFPAYCQYHSRDYPHVSNTSEKELMVSFNAIGSCAKRNLREKPFLSLLALQRSWPSRALPQTRPCSQPSLQIISARQKLTTHTLSTWPSSPDDQQHSLISMTPLSVSFVMTTMTMPMPRICFYQGFYLRPLALHHLLSCTLAVPWSLCGPLYYLSGS